MRLSYLCLVSSWLRVLLSIDLRHGRVGHVRFWASIDVLLGLIVISCYWHILFDDIVILDGSEIEQRLLLDRFCGLLCICVARVDLVCRCFVGGHNRLIHVVVICAASCPHVGCTLSLMVVLHPRDLYRALSYYLLL